MKWQKPDATESEIIDALKTAQAWEFVSNLENGVYSEILQGGKNFQVGKSSPDHC